MSLTKVSKEMVSFAVSINVQDYGATGNGYTDDSSAFQSAVNEAIATSGTVVVPAGNYLIGTTITLPFVGGVYIQGTAQSSLGTRSTLIQKDLNVPVFTSNAVTLRMSGLSFTTFAGYSTNSNGNIIAVSTTSNTITFNANAFPTLWVLAVPVLSTDLTSYSSVIQFSCNGSYYASGSTVNGNGTITLTGVKGANGTLNGSLSGAVGLSVTFVSLAAAINQSVLTNPNAGIIYLSVKENPFFDNLWFYGVTRCFNISELGSGSGPGVGVGNMGFLNTIVVDGAINLIYAQGGIYGLQIINSQFYGVDYAFKAVLGNFYDSVITNCMLLIAKLFIVNTDVIGVNINGCNFNAVNALGYSNGLMVAGGNIQDSVIVGNNFGRSTDVVINATNISGTIFSANTILSNGESTVNPFIFVGGTVLTSRFSDNNFAAQYSSNSKRLNFSSITASVAGSVFGDDFVNYTNNSSVGWVQVTTFTNSWANTGGGTQTIAYFKDNNGIINLRGSASGGTAGTAVFTLPLGYRPNTGGAAIKIPIVNSGVVGYIEINGSGVVGSFGSLNAWQDFTGISFPTI